RLRFARDLLDVEGRHDLAHYAAVSQLRDRIAADDVAGILRAYIGLVTNERVVAQLKLEIVPLADDVDLPGSDFAGLINLLSIAADHRHPRRDLRDALAFGALAIWRNRALATVRQKAILRSHHAGIPDGRERAFEELRLILKRGHHHGYKALRCDRR